MLLRTFGGLTLEGAAGDETAPSLAPRRLALLSIVAAANENGVARERVLGLLWANTREDQARHTLAQTVYSIRRDVVRPLITGSTVLRLDPSIDSDIGSFRRALETDDLEAAISLYRGPFLDGFWLPGVPEFERWVEETRASLHFAVCKALETLANRAITAGSPIAAVHWWRRFSEIDPLNTSCAAGYIRATMQLGDNVSALRFAREYEERIRRELDVGPSRVISELMTELRARCSTATRNDALPNGSSASPPDASRTAAASSGNSHSPLAAVPSESSTESEQVHSIARSVRARPLLRRVFPAALTAAAVVLVAIGAWRIRDGIPAASAAERSAIFVIGSIRSADSASLGPELRDVLATHLARVSGMQVAANPPIELRGSDDARVQASIADAARRTGASEILEGEITIADAALRLMLRRVSTPHGVLLQGYTLRGSDVHDLAAQVTAAIATDLKLDPPPDNIASVRTRSAIALALYEQGVRAFYRGDANAAARLTLEAFERDSTFAMAAAYAWLAQRQILADAEAARLLPRVKRLAAGSTRREQLWINAIVAQHDGSPLSEFVRFSSEMVERFPDDAEGLVLHGQAVMLSGDFAAAVAAYNAAVRIDSAVGVSNDSWCRLCVSLHWIHDAYMWWDSLPAVERTAQRIHALLPADNSASSGRVEMLLRQGRRKEAEAMQIALRNINPGWNIDLSVWLDRDLIRAGRLDEFETKLVATLRTTGVQARGELPWLLAIALRNQGRLREASEFSKRGKLPNDATVLAGHHDAVSLAIIALENGEPRVAADRFLEMVADDKAQRGPLGVASRNIAWHMTLAGTALAAAGDTASVRALADSVERIGRLSSFGRDFRLHHFLRGLLLQDQGRHEEAVLAFQKAIFSATDGYTRINFEMARSLMAVQRHGEAIATLQPALRGGVDGGNTYITHTELHEALAHAFFNAGQRDSASVHYAAAARAWRKADPRFAARYELARQRSAATTR